MSKLTGYVMWLAALLGVPVREVGAATLMVNASQKPGMVVICNRNTEIPQNGYSPVRIDSLLKGVVLRNDGDRLVFDVIYTQRNAAQPGPFRKEKYRLTTELEATRQKMVIYHETIELSLPYAHNREEYFLDLLKASTVSYDDYSTYRVTSATNYQILPSRTSPTWFAQHPVEPLP